MILKIDAEAEAKILIYVNKCMSEGTYFFKARDIAEEIGGITSRKVGATLFRMSEKEKKTINIFKYAKSGSRHTWKAEVVM